MKKLALLVVMGMLLCAPTANLSADCGLCGDVNGDGEINIADVVMLVAWPKYPYPEPTCPAAADMDCQYGVNWSPGRADIDILVNYMFYGGPAPCDPVAFPNCS